MSTHQTTPAPKLNWRFRLLLRIVPPLFRGYLWLVLRTSRIERVNMDVFYKAADAGGVSLGCCWHQEIFMGPLIYGGRTAATMISNSRHGDLIAAAVERTGCIPVRGSSSSGGRTALNELLELAERRGSLLTGLVTDGPRGPAFKSKTGIVLMARELGVPLHPLRIWASRRWLLPSWDQTVVPFPFGRLIFLCGEPLSIPKDAEGDKLESYREELDRRLNELVRISHDKFPLTPSEQAFRRRMQERDRAIQN